MWTGFVGGVDGGGVDTEAEGFPGVVVRVDGGGVDGGGVDGGGVDGGGVDTEAECFPGAVRVEGRGAHSHVAVGSGSCARASAMPCALPALHSPASMLHCAASSDHLAAVSAHWAFTSAHRPTRLPFFVPLANQLSDFLFHFVASFPHLAADLVHFDAVFPNLAPLSTQSDGLASEPGNSPADEISGGCWG